jgi:hypothetical protein
LARHRRCRGGISFLLRPNTSPPQQGEWAYSPKRKITYADPFPQRWIANRSKRTRAVHFGHSAPAASLHPFFGNGGLGLPRQAQRFSVDGYANHEENRVILLVASRARGHRSPWRDRKGRLQRLGRRARTVTRRRCIAPGTARQVRRIMERRAVVELPAFITVLYGQRKLFDSMYCAGQRTVADARNRVGVRPIS